MNKTAVEQKIAHIIQKIRQDYEPQKIILYGSYARGEPTEDSDVDLFIIKETSASIVERFVEVKRLIYDPKWRIPVSPLVYTPQEVEERLRSGDDFVKEVMRGGKVLYEQED